MAKSQIQDPGVKGLQQVPEFGPKTVAVLRAELGDVQRFARTDEVIAYGGMDIEIKESGLWKGKAKLSKRGSGLLRRMLYLAALRSIHQTGSADCEPTINAWWSAASKKVRP